MDIFLGSSHKISDELKARFLNYASLGEFKPMNPSDFLCVLKKSRGEGIVIGNEQVEIIFDGYLPGLEGKALEASVIQLNDIIKGEKAVDYRSFSGIFNLCILEKNSGNIWLTSDPSAILPLYYCLKEGNLYYCSHLHIMAAVLNSTPDYQGVAQRSYMGFTLGSRTLYDGIMRLNPGETIIFSKGKSAISSQYNSVYYSAYIHDNNVEEQLFAGLSSSFREMSKLYDTVGLMLSEGADSRFLGGIARKEGLNIKSYTHITPGAGGEKIVEKVAGMLGSDHHFQSIINGYSTSKEHLEEQLLLTDNLSYPFWMLGSDYFRQINSDYPVIIGSSLDCILDGNIFYKPAKKKRQAVIQRYSEIFKQNTGLLKHEYIERLSAELIKCLYVNLSNYQVKSVASQFQPEISLSITEELQCLKGHISSEMNRLSASGSSLPSLQLQRYILENRDRKLFFGQPLTIRKHNRIYIPSFEYNFLSKASAIRPVHKLHHKLYLSMLRTFLPEQLKIKSGTYGIAPRNPRIILETSRFIHKCKEKKLYRELLDNKGNIDMSSFRSATILELCGRSDDTHKAFEQLILSNSDVFNAREMQSYIDQVRDYKIRTFNFERLYRGLEICQVMKGGF